MLRDMAAEQPASLGTRIKRARERKRWKQRQLAEALDVNIKTIDNWENDRTSPRSSIGALEEVLGVSLTGPEPEPVIPPSLIAAIRRSDLTPEQQEAAIDALEYSLRGAPEPGASAPSEPSRRAG